MMTMKKMFQKVVGWYYEESFSSDFLVKVIEIHFDDTPFEEKIYQKDIIFEKFIDFERYAEKFELYDIIDYDTQSMYDEESNSYLINYVVIYLIRQITINYQIIHKRREKYL